MIFFSNKKAGVHFFTGNVKIIFAMEALNIVTNTQMKYTAV